MVNATLIDRYGRRLNYLRVSITDRCNLKCIYCSPLIPSPKLTHKEILRYEEILRLIKIGIRLGITKVRITGGEPLVRKGIYDFLANLSSLRGLEDVSLTTNGVLLKDNLDKLKSGGIRRINISLDTLNPHRFEQITGYDKFYDVWEGIQTALKMGFDPVKLNIVTLAGINDDELIDLAGLSFSYPLHIRFIEHMPVGKFRLKTDHILLAPDILKRLRSLGKLIRVNHEAYDGPARRYRFEGAKGEIGIISALSDKFCHQCNRLRLTSSGWLRTCLLTDYQLDLKTPLRNGCLDDEIADLFSKAAHEKPFQHNLNRGHWPKISSQMCTIGG